MRLTVGRKLFGSSGLTILLVALVSTYIVFQMREFDGDLKGYNQYQQELKLARGLQLDIALIWQYLTDASLTRNRGLLEKEVKDHLARANQGIAGLIVSSKRNNHQDTVRELSRLRDDLARTHELGVRMVQAYLQDGKRGQALMVEFDRANELVLKEIGDIVQKIETSTEETYREMQGMLGASIRYTIIVLVLVILFSLGLMSAINYQITNPLRKMTKAADTIATGDISVEINHRSNDETGGLADSLRTMIIYLKETALVSQEISAGNMTVEVKPRSDRDILGISYQTMVTNLSRIVEELKESVSVLGSSGREIITATNQFAAATAQTATAVNETTATVEEVKQTTRLSSQKAKAVSDLSRKTLDVSQAGRDSIEETIKGMGQIKDQMEIIAASIIQLSEQSKAIFEIINTVNDLAEQSNILAVNAAIEAAKAGEQGKGFAVVAKEVRNLAEQSKQATGQIRGILNDIQRATNKAVLVTEQGGKAVDAGMRLAAEAGEAISVLSGSIEESSQAAAQISASSQEQMAGMDQVAQAMENIRQASTQNAAGAKQVEAAAINLNEMGNKLKTITEAFKI